MGNICTLQGQYEPLWKPRMDPELKGKTWQQHRQANQKAGFPQFQTSAFPGLFNELSRICPDIHDLLKIILETAGAHLHLDVR